MLNRFIVALGLVFGLSNNTYSQTSQPVEVIFTQISGCNADLRGELIVLHTTCGFEVDGLVLEIDTNYLSSSVPSENSFNSPNGICKWTDGDIDVFEDCENLISVGAGDYIPPQSIVIIQMTADMATISSFRGQCDLDIPMYVLRNGCERITEVFPHRSYGDTVQLKFNFIGIDSFEFVVPGDYDPDWYSLPLQTIGKYSAHASSCRTPRPPIWKTVLEQTYDLETLIYTAPECDEQGMISIPRSASEYSIDGGLTWSADSVFQDLESGTYRIMVRDETNNCPVAWLDPIVFEPYTSPEFLAVSWLPHADNTCTDMKADLQIDFRVGSSGSDVDTTMYEFSIDSGISFQNSRLFTDLSEGTFHLAIRDRSSPQCIVHQSWASPPFPNPPTIIGLAHDSTGFCDDGRVEILSTGVNVLYSIDGISYHFDPFVVLQPGVPYKVFVKEYGDDRCIDSMDVILHQTPEFIADVVVTSQSAEFILLVESKGPYKLLWSTGDTTATVTGLPAGVNHLEITDGWGCKQTYAFFITETTCVFQITDSIVDATCETSLTSIYLSNADTFHDYLYDWSIDEFDGFPFIENVPHGTYAVTVSYGACSKEIQYTTPIGGITAVDYRTEPAGCADDEGNFVILKISGGEGPYQLDISNQLFDSTMRIAGFSAGNYAFTVSDSRGCLFQDTFLIMSDVDVPAVEPKVMVVDCDQSIYDLDLSGLSGGLPPYQIMFNGIIHPDLLISDLVPGEYLLEIIDAVGCTSNTIDITLPEIQTVAIKNQDTVLLPGSRIYLMARIDENELNDFHWYGPEGKICDCIGIDFSPQEPGLYSFQYQLKSGCTGEVSFSIDIPGRDIFIPNSFSPNGDDINDDFEIFAPNHKILSLQVYDRWGDRIYFDHGPDFSWNGKAGQTDVQPGVYIYQVTLQDAAGRFIHESGSIHLVR